MRSNKINHNVKKTPGLDRCTINHKVYLQRRKNQKGKKFSTDFKKSL